MSLWCLPSIFSSVRLWVWEEMSFEEFRPSWISERNDFSNSESPCCHNASYYVSAQSNLWFWRRCRKCEHLTTDGRTMDDGRTDDGPLHKLTWSKAPGELIANNHKSAQSGLWTNNYASPERNPDAPPPPPTPQITSSMGVIPKPDGEVRLNYDCSLQPVNDYGTINWHQRFSRVDDAAALVTEGCYMAKVDLHAAYRHVKISDYSKQVTGLKWQFCKQTVYLGDTRLCFGSKLAPDIFHRIAQAVKRMLIRRGLTAIHCFLRNKTKLFFSSAIPECCRDYTSR